MFQIIIIVVVFYLFAFVKRHSNARFVARHLVCWFFAQWWQLTLTEGRTREVRRALAAVGCTVSRLLRVQYGPIVLPPDLESGQVREATEEERSSIEWFRERSA